MHKRVHDESGAFANELPVERLATANLRAYQLTLTERLLCDPGGRDRGRAADERPEDGGHCADDRGIHRVASAPGIANIDCARGDPSIRSKMYPSCRVAGRGAAQRRFRRPPRISTRRFVMALIP